MFLFLGSEGRAMAQCPLLRTLVGTEKFWQSSCCT